MPRNADSPKAQETARPQVTASEATEVENSAGGLMDPHNFRDRTFRRVVGVCWETGAPSGRSAWARQDSNLRPPACKVDPDPEE